MKIVLFVQKIRGSALVAWTNNQLRLISRSAAETKTSGEGACVARSFKELRERMTPAARQRADRRMRETLVEMNLQELRQQVAGVTQTELAQLMKVTQGAISQLEKRHDVLLSKLAGYVHALGGELDLIARFPRAEVRIRQFSAERTADTTGE